MEGKSKRFTAEENEHRSEAERCQKEEVARDAMTFFFVWRIHETAAVLDDENLAPETLHVRQRLEQGGSF